MVKTARIDNDVLLTAGLDLMTQIGKPLKRIQSPGRSMLFEFSSGETVRARTCNDHLLIVVADSPANDAKLNIEGTDWLLIIMPEIERTPGRVCAYLVPTAVAAEAARSTHKDWLSTNPNTRGSNTTWNLWFDKEGPEKANDFASKWSRYRLNATSGTHSPDGSETTPEPSNVKSEVEQARQRISRAAGVPLAAVRITVDFS
jgi:hypothetical protein